MIMDAGSDLMNYLESDDFIKKLPKLYGKNVHIEYQIKRYSNIIDFYKEIYGNYIGNSIALYSTSGRTELAGNHTDHNRGRVIAASIDLDTIGVACRCPGSIISLVSQGFAPVNIDIGDLSVHPNEAGTTLALVRGIAAGFVKRGFRIGSFKAVTSTNVPKGSGLSSSAAIEMLCATMLNDMYNDNTLDTIEMAVICQEAENMYFGKPCGLMDQIACGYGGIVEIDFLSSDGVTVSPITNDIASFGYDIVIVDTKKDHADLQEAYAAIPREMKDVAKLMEKTVLGEVSPQDYYASIRILRNKLENDRALLRAHHFFFENERVTHMADALRSGDFIKYLYLVQQSGNSSFMFLQNLYENNHWKSQSLPLALAVSERLLHDRGAFRVHGGGFAGTIQAYVPKELTCSYTSAMEKLFGPGCVQNITIRELPSARLNC